MSDETKSTGFPTRIAEKASALEIFEAMETTPAAIEWMNQNGFPADAILERLGKVVLVHAVPSYADRSMTLAFDFIDAAPNAAAFPVYRDGEIIDLLLVEIDAVETTLLCYDSDWLGHDALLEPVVRLHAKPLDWLASGCEGACHIRMTSRAALRDLSAAQTILCDNISVAMDVWDWAFDADESELSRFEVDDTPENIRDFFRAEAAWLSHISSRRVAA